MKLQYLQFPTGLFIENVSHFGIPRLQIRNIILNHLMKIVSLDIGILNLGISILDISEDWILIDITDINATADNYIAISVVCDNDHYFYGGYITISRI